MIVFQVSLKVDAMKEILKIRSQIYILMKKVIILRKIHLAMITFGPEFFNHFSLSLNKKTCGNDSHEKETKHIHVAPSDLLHIRIKNLD